MKPVVFMVDFRKKDRIWLKKAVETVRQESLTAEKRNLRIADPSSEGEDGETFKKWFQQYPERDEIILILDESPFVPFPGELSEIRTAIDYFGKGWHAKG